MCTPIVTFSLWMYMSQAAPQGDEYWRGERRLCAAMRLHAQRCSVQGSGEVDADVTALVGAQGTDRPQEQHMVEGAACRPHPLPAQSSPPPTQRPSHKRCRPPGSPPPPQQQPIQEGQTQQTTQQLQGPGFSLQDVLRVHEAKSFDYRVRVLACPA
jgi:hypothetical protein